MGPVHILSALEKAGHRAVFVGGCVRDTLLGRPVHDWDIATSATPEEIMEAFPKTIPTGLKHGTVTVVVGGESFEVTTFRRDGGYKDGRHPEKVTFVRELQEDLSRRDFTVNAMAMDGNGNITDLFGGREDLQKGLLRCVGDPVQRFREDALRMLRALRFSAQLGFSVDAAAMEAMTACAGSCRLLSAERVREEVEKTLLSSAPHTVEVMAALGLLTAVGQEAAPVTLPRDLPPHARWAGLLLACPGMSWQSLRLDRQTGRIAAAAADLGTQSRSRLGWKQVIALSGAETARCAAALSGEEDTVLEILSSGECVSLRQLAVRGADLPHLTGRDLGDELERLLQHVLRHPEDNTKERLLALAEKFSDA